MRKEPTKILIVSALKPANEVRMRERLAFSLLPTFEVHLAGTHPSKEILQEDGNIRFHFEWPKPRSFRERIQIWKRLAALHQKVKPEVIIITTVELLLPAILLRIRSNVKVIYDVQENFYRNFLYHPHYSPPFHFLLALFSRTVEFMTFPFVEHYLLAEKAYLSEMPFLRKKATVLENKCRLNESELVLLSAKQFPKRLSRESGLKVALTGTFSTVFGTYQALTWLSFFLGKNPENKAVLVGWSAEAPLLEALLDFTNRFSEQVEMIGGNYHVAHPKIIKELLDADVALLPYQMGNPSTMNCIPSKMYECLALGIPMLISPNPLWMEKLAGKHAAVFLDFSKLENFNTSLEQLLVTSFFPNGPEEEAKWQKESGLLARLLENLIPD